MSMIEIQELTRRMARSGQLIEESFAGGAREFSQWMPALEGEYSEAKGIKRFTGIWGARLAAVPLRPLSLMRLSRQEWLSELQPENFSGPGRQGTLRPYDIAFRGWVPRLRAIERQFGGDSLVGLDRIGEAGNVGRFVRAPYSDTHRVRGILELHQFMWHVASVLRLVDIVRARAERPNQVFALEIEFGSSDGMRVSGYAGSMPGGGRDIPLGRIVLPRYEVGPRDDFNEVLTTIDSDFWNMAGLHPDWRLEVKWGASHDRS